MGIIPFMLPAPSSRLRPQLASQGCAKAQTWTDFTEKIVNPSFETGTTAETVAGELTGSMAGELTGLGWSIHDGYFSIPFRVS